MDTYLNTPQIRQMMIEPTEVEWQYVFSLYQGSEFKKWEAQHGQEEAKSHIASVEENFKRGDWKKGRVFMKDLLNLKMNPAEWIKELAQNPDKTPAPFEIPTLGQVKNNLHLNQHSPFYNRIFEIQDAVRDGRLTNESIFFILMTYPDSTYSLADGNSRLIALSTMKEMEEYHITCYLG